MAFFNDKQTTTSKQQTEQEDIIKKQSQLIENIQSVNDVDLQHNMLDKFMPYSHKSLHMVITIFNIVYSALFILLIYHFFVNLFIYNNWRIVSGDFFMLVVAGIITAIVKTRNLVRQYRMFMFIILLSLVFHIINFVGFQNVLAKKISEADIKAIIQAVRSNG